MCVLDFLNVSGLRPTYKTVLDTLFSAPSSPLVQNQHFVYFLGFVFSSLLLWRQIDISRCMFDLSAEPGSHGRGKPQRVFVFAPP